MCVIYIDVIVHQCYTHQVTCIDLENSLIVLPQGTREWLNEHLRQIGRYGTNRTPKKEVGERSFNNYHCILVNNNDDSNDYDGNDDDGDDDGVNDGNDDDGNDDGDNGDNGNDDDGDDEDDKIHLALFFNLIQYLANNA